MANSFEQKKNLVLRIVIYDPFQIAIFWRDSNHTEVYYKTSMQNFYDYLNRKLWFNIKNDSGRLFVTSFMERAWFQEIFKENLLKYMEIFQNFIGFVKTFEKWKLRTLYFCQLFPSNKTRFANISTFTVTTNNKWDEKR